MPDDFGEHATDVSGRDLDDLMFCPEEARHPGLKCTFVKVGVVEGNGKSGQAIRGELLNQSGDE